VLTDDETFPAAVGAERRLDRRRFLSAAGCAALLVAGGEWAAAAIGSAPPFEVRLDRPLAPGAVREVAVGERQALVIRLADGATVAFDRRCPHLGCPVLWSAERNRFECPCHRAAFEARTGRVLFGPPRQGLTRAEVRFT
jgi:nitrite reductase/ring-hydroxylating ferredoxin subunit